MKKYLIALALISVLGITTANSSEATLNEGLVRSAISEELQQQSVVVLKNGEMWNITSVDTVRVAGHHIVVGFSVTPSSR